MPSQEVVLLVFFYYCRFFFFYFCCFTLIYYNHKTCICGFLLADNLVSRVAKSLPQEVEAARTQRWDTVLVNQYLYELREAKKQGRKERRHKEAQAVLAAATAAAAASSRISSRKDGLEDSSPQEVILVILFFLYRFSFCHQIRIKFYSIPLQSVLKLNASVGSAGISSHPRAKDALTRNAVPRISSEKYSNIVQSASDFFKEHPRSCDICRRSETLLNPILVCSGCKVFWPKTISFSFLQLKFYFLSVWNFDLAFCFQVAVHLDCYRNVKESTGPWCCELCEELFLSRSSGAPSPNFWEKPYPAAECGLCGGTTGAFRKSVNGLWIHAFCAEVIFVFFPDLLIFHLFPKILILSYYVCSGFLNQHSEGDK